MNSEPEACPHRPTCPGCPRFGEAGLDPNTHARLVALAQASRIPEPEIHFGDALAYRTRARLAVRGRTNSPKVGLFQSGSHRIADTPRCPIHHPRINEVAGILRAGIRKTGIEPYADRPHRGQLRYLQGAIERETGRAQVVLVGNSDSEEPLLPLFEFLEGELGDVLQGLWWNGNPERDNAILGPHWKHIAGEPALRERVAGIEIFQPPGAFGQSHPALFEKLAASARAAVPDGSRVLELYAGVGPIGLGLAATSECVSLNELSPDALRGLELGIAERPEAERARIEVLPGDAADHLDQLARHDVVLVDPPRRGLDPRVLEAVCSSAARRVIYVSCGLDSLERDLAALTGSGRHLSSVEAYDLFPYTGHVEALAILDSPDSG